MIVKKAILPVAGLGTRTLPASKSIPKEMFPILAKPVIQYLVEEAIGAGIDEIIFVISKEKELIRNYFTRDEALEKIIEAKGRASALTDLNAIIDKIKIKFCYQNEPRGDGHAIMCAKEHINGEACAILFGDDLIQNQKGGLQQLMENFKHYQSSMVAVTKIEPKESEKYGIINISEKIDNCYRVKDMVEKPNATNAPSNLAIIGKYIITPPIIEYLSQAESSHGEEIRLIDGFIRALNSKKEEIIACELKGRRYDTGNIEGLLQANIGYALANKELSSGLKTFLINGFK